MNMNKKDMLSIISKAIDKNNLLKHQLENSENPQEVAIRDKAIGKLEVLHAVNMSLSYSNNVELKMLAE